MTRIIALVNHKGGVGKTTSTLNLGKAFSLSGQKVLIIDIDPQANLSQSVGIRDPEPSVYDALCNNQPLPIREISENFSIAPASLNLAVAEISLQSESFSGYKKLKKSLTDIQSLYDYVLIDCPPSLGILTVNAMAAASEVIIVAEAEYLSVTGLQTILNLYQKIREDLNPDLEILGFLFTQFNRTVVGKGIIKSIQDSFQNKVFQTVIRENVRISEASAHRQDIFTYDNASAGAEDYMNLCKEIMNHP